jgi:hypothetical protein
VIVTDQKGNFKRRTHHRAWPHGTVIDGNSIDQVFHIIAPAVHVEFSYWVIGIRKIPKNKVEVMYKRAIAALNSLN